MKQLMLALGLLAVLPGADPGEAEGGGAAIDGCDARQCLVEDFIARRNGADSAEAALNAFGAFLREPWYALPAMAGDAAGLCRAVPSTACFRRVITLRQKIYHDREGTPVACLILGGIAKEDGRYRSYGVTYRSDASRWVPSGIDYFYSLADVPTATDLLRDPCVPSGT